MTDAEVSDIMKRLARVERKVRRCRAALAGVALVVAAGVGAPLLVAAAKVPETIRAKRFQVVDDAGAVRAVLAMDGDNVGLGLFDTADKPRAKLATAGDDVGLNLFDKAGKLRAGLGTVGDNASLSFFDTAGKPRAALATVGDDVSLGFLDKAGKVRALLATINGDVGLHLLDKAGKPRAELGNTELSLLETGSPEHRPVSSLVLFRKNGKVLWQAP